MPRPKLQDLSQGKSVDELATLLTRAAVDIMRLQTENARLRKMQLEMIVPIRVEYTDRGLLRFLQMSSPLASDASKEM